MSTILKNAVKAGRCWNGAHRDRGQTVHIVPALPSNTVGDWFSKSLCGTEPGRRSYGWSETQSEASCQKCINKMKKSNQILPEPEQDEFEEETEFIPCEKCDGHQACEDFGCAFKLGIGHLVNDNELT